jgi:hypothetical protein
MFLELKPMKLISIPTSKRIAKPNISEKTSRNPNSLPNKFSIYTPKIIGINNRRVNMLITMNFFIF